jgi:N-methylhydantoinase B
VGLSGEVAERVYGVVIRDGAVDELATHETRVGLRRERLNGVEPREPVAPPEGAWQVGDALHVVDGRWFSHGADLGPVSDNYRAHAVIRETPVRNAEPEFAATDVEMADQIVLREYLCPVTGYRIDAELARAGEPLLHDIALGG